MRRAPLQRSLGEAVSGLVELALPRQCGGCTAVGKRWCPGCAAFLAAARPRAWAPTPVPDGAPPTWTALPYEGPVRRAVVAWKDQGRRDLTPVLATVLALALAQARAEDAVLAGCAAAGTPVVLVPAPSSRAALRRRGDHPMGLLAAGAARSLPGAVVIPALQVGRAVADQAGLGQQARAANLAGAMRVPDARTGSVAGACCVVLDDVVTTGATLAEAARSLRSAGARHVLAVTLAATRRRG